MARRVIAIPLAVAIAIAVFSSFCLAVIPDNNTVVSYDVKILDLVNGVYPNSAFSLYPFFNFTTGNSYFIMTADSTNGVPSSDNNRLYTELNLDVKTTYDLYLMVNKKVFNAGLIDISQLSQYYNASGTLEHVYSNPEPSYSFIMKTGANTFTPYTLDFHIGTTVLFLLFEDVPAGSSFVVTDNSYSYNSPSIVSAGGYSWAVRNIGVYVSAQYYTSDLVVDDYIAGKSTLQEALQDLNVAINDAVSRAETPDQVQFEILKGQYELDRLISNSDIKSVTNVQQTITPALDQTINDYASGNLSLDDALSDMSQQYSSALNSAETPEQGTFLNTTYHIKIQQLELDARRKAAAKVDSAISDEQLSDADDYYQSEEELISKFEVAEFESALDFELWYNTLPPAESTEYKKFFDYILNDSSIRMFLVIPISLVLVRIIFGTVLHLRIRHD